VTVRDGEGQQLRFAFRRAMRLKVLMAYVASKIGVEPGNASFTFQGRPLLANETADGIGFGDHDVIDVNRSFPEEAEPDESGSSASAADDADLAAPEAKVHLVAKNLEGREVHVNMLPAARLQIFMGMACRKLRLQQKEVRFLHNGTRLRPGDTPEHLGLADGDVVEVEPDPAYFEALHQAEEEARLKAEAEQRAQEEAERRSRERTERKALLARRRERQAAVEWGRKLERIAKQAFWREAQEEAQKKQLEAAERKRKESAERAEQEARDEEQKRARFGDLVHLLVRDEQGRELRVKYRMRLRMRALFLFARKQWGLEQARLDFTHAGATVRAEDTAEALDLHDMEVIEVKAAPGSTVRLPAEQNATAQLTAERWTHHQPGVSWRTTRRGKAKRAKEAKEAEGWVVIEPDADTDAMQ